MYAVVCGLQSERGLMTKAGDGLASEVSIPAKRQQGAPSVGCPSQLENTDDDFVDAPNVVRDEVRRDPSPDAPDVAWDCGLVKGDQAALDRFHLQYIRELCTANINSPRTSNVARAIQFLSSLGIPR